MFRRLLMVRLSAIGDVINVLPAVSAVRQAFPDAYIGFAVEDRAKDVVIGHPDIDRVFVFPRKRWVKLLRYPAGFFQVVREAWQFIRNLRKERFEVSLDFQGNLKGALHSFASGAPRRIGFARGYCYEMNYLFSNFHIVPAGAHRVEKFMSLVHALGVSTVPGPYKLPEGQVTSRVEAFVKGLNGFVVLHPGTSDFGREKRWPTERFGQLVKRVRRLGLEVVVTWGPGEEELARQVTAGGDAHLAPRTEGLNDLAHIIRRARLFISADTGPMHLAAAAGVPCVALFGPKDPAVYGPFGKVHRVVYRGAMDEITVDDALGAVQEILRAT